MLKFTLTTDPPTLALGLSFENLKALREGPLDTFIRVDGKAMGLPMDVVIFAGSTEQEIMRAFADKIGPETKVHIDPRMRDG